METNQIQCLLCASLVKNYIGDDRSKYNACCDKCLIVFTNNVRPRIIKANITPSVPLVTPSWCPRKRGVIGKEYINPNALSQEISKFLPSPSETKTQTSNQNSTRKMTYTEKMEEMKKLPKRLEWEEIKEDGVYVIPRILTKTRKVVRIIEKNENFLRCSEINEYGNESKSLTTIYQNDVDTIFITKVRKY